MTMFVPIVLRVKRPNHEEMLSDPQEPHFGWSVTAASWFCTGVCFVWNQVQEAVDAGLTVVVAAGNYQDDACGHSPSSALSALTVGSTDESDQMVSDSSYGSCLDIFAPGTQLSMVGAFTWRDSIQEVLCCLSVFAWL